MNNRRVVVVGGGAAGVFAAIHCAEMKPGSEVMVLEKTSGFLSKVRISGGGRCNVTHACFDARELAAGYPRGEQALIAPFQRFQAADVVDWFESRGVRLKAESDGRMFPVTDSSETIINCLIQAASRAGVRLVSNSSLRSVRKRAAAGFDLTLSDETELACDRLLLATGGCRTPALGGFAVSLGHTLIPPVPSLFTFHIETPWLRKLAGVSVPVNAAVPGTRLREGGPLLVTHWGLSGPVILRLSAWGARELHELGYRFPLQINWLPDLGAECIASRLRSRVKGEAARRVVNSPLAPLSARLWEQLVIAAGILPETRWASLSRSDQHRLAQTLTRLELPVTGKSLNKDEFVTCGGVALSEIDFRTMESRPCPGLFFAGELLDIDGITGGFNFQAAWTTGWIAGQSMAK